MKIFNLLKARARAEPTQENKNQEEDINLERVFSSLLGMISTQINQSMYTNYAVNTCLQKIERACCNIELGIYKRDKKGNFIKSESATAKYAEKIIKDPNNKTNWDGIIKSYISGVYLGGSYLFRRVKGILKDDLYIYNNQSFRLERDPRTLEIVSINFNNGQTFTGVSLNDFVLGIEFNPTSMIQGIEEGWPRAKALEPIVKQLNGSFVYNTSFFENGGTLKGVLNFPHDDKMSVTQKKQLEDKFKDHFTGARNNGKLQISFEPKSPEYTAVSMPVPKDLEYVEGNKENEKKIALLLGVPLPLVTSESSTYNNLSEAKKELYEETAIPLIKTLCQYMNKLYKYDLEDGEEWYFNEATIKALQFELTDNLKKTVDSLTGIATVNETIKKVNEMYGLDLPTLGEKGDIVLTLGSYINLEDMSIIVNDNVEGHPYEQKIN